MGNELNITDGIRSYRIERSMYGAYVYPDFEAKLLFGVDCASYTVLYKLNYHWGNSDCGHKGADILLDYSVNDFSVRASKACYESVIKLLKKRVMFSNGDEDLKNLIKSGEELCMWWGMEFYLDNDFYVVFNIDAPDFHSVPNAILYKKPKEKLCTAVLDSSYDVSSIGAVNISMCRRFIPDFWRNCKSNYSQDCMIRGSEFSFKDSKGNVIDCYWGSR